MTDLLGVQDHLEVSEDGEFTRVATQEFAPSYWEGLQWARAEDARSRTPDLWRVGSVPAVFVEKWLREGFDVWREPAKAIVARCKAQGLTDFLVTGKRV